ncbi:ras-related and estrogen-regulated growth inhibitor-like [Hydractinia symbiolongicarpus]|uniref:ras-related and estrogen-regulated growth inhibitor-like n=1 Tax=Hydractinia symbiolongicarpus TaxID=13093 RepID=UPI00254EDAA4|nr:ras-related and estrogen-regulated growth inhibitor-like [Hydractinia symbiolongicarpus]XP_057290472.1 ras-related and estrogen-regulated growth inhibitor-like [Hydractinia symbiolongicarpus]
MDYLLPPTNTHHQHQNGESQADIRLLLLGSRGVGKSALVVRYITRRFIGDYDHSFDTRYITSVNMQNRISQIEFIDPVYCEQETDELQRNHVIRTDGIILVYSVTDRESFYNISVLYEYIHNIRLNDIPPVVIVANKIDLDGTKQVSTTEGCELAQKLNCAYYETSAADLTIGYGSLCDAITEISENVLQKQAQRKVSTGQRKRSLSPKPLRKAIVKMFGKHREHCDHHIAAFS